MFSPPPPKNKQQKKLYTAHKDTIETKSSMPLILWENNTEHLSYSTTKILFTWWLASLWLCLSGLKKRFCSLSLPFWIFDSSQHFCPELVWGGGGKGKWREGWTEHGLSRKQLLSHTTQRLSHTPLFSAIEHCQQKNKWGVGGAGDKEGRTRGRPFLSATSEARSPLWFLAAKARDPMRPLRVQLNLLLQKEQFPAASAGSSKHRSIVNVSYRWLYRGGLWLHSWEGLLLETCHTAVVKTHKQEVVKIPSKILGFWRNAAKH